MTEGAAESTTAEEATEQATEQKAAEELDITEVGSGDSESDPTPEQPGANRDGRVFVVGPSKTTFPTTRRPILFSEDGAVIVTAATLPPSSGGSGGDSFVSVKVSVSSESETPETTSPRPSASPVEALFTMWADGATSPLPLSGESEASNDDHAHDDHADHADHADHDNGDAQTSSLVNKPPAAVLAASANRPEEPKPTLFDQEEILAYSTVKPRYRDPDSLFKRKTFLESAAPGTGSLSWTLATGTAVLLMLWNRA